MGVRFRARKNAPFPSHLESVGQTSPVAGGARAGLITIRVRSLTIRAASSITAPFGPSCGRSTVGCSCSLTNFTNSSEGDLLDHRIGARVHDFDEDFVQFVVELDLCPVAAEPEIIERLCALQVLAAPVERSCRYRSAGQTIDWSLTTASGLFWRVLTADPRRRPNRHPIARSIAIATTVAK